MELEGRHSLIVVLSMPVLKPAYSYPAVEPVLHFSPTIVYNLLHSKYSIPIPEVNMTIIHTTSLIKKSINSRLLRHAAISTLLLLPFPFLLFPSATHASTLFFHPQNEVMVEEGESVVVDVYLDTQGKSVNAVDAVLGFPQHIVEVVDVSRGGSVLTLWISDPVVDNQAGIVRLTGGIPAGGSFSAGILARITFRAKAEGEGTLSWSDTSQVLLNDGRGSRDEVEILQTSLRVTPVLTDVPRITSITHPDQSTWYQATALFVSWQLDPDAVYSYALDHDPKGFPDEITDTPQGELRFDGSIKYEGLEEGVYYFHLRQKKGREVLGGWSRTRTFRAQIDTTTPATLQTEIGSDPSLFEGRYFASFSATDQLSGIDRYDVWETGLDWTTGVKPPYELRHQDPSQPIRVRAIDKAGNMKEEVVAYPARSAKTFRLWATLTAMGVIGLAVGVWIGRKLRKKKS